MFLEILLLIIIVIVLVYLFVYFAEVVFSPSSEQYSTGSVCVGETCFKVELAKTVYQIEKGLMYRKELDKDAGMLFIFEKEGIYPFWMKNTLIPLDIIWVDNGSRVVFISQNTQPCKSLICKSVFPNSKAKYVLEVNAGVVDKIGLKVGDSLKINY